MTTPSEKSGQGSEHCRIPHLVVWKYLPTHPNPIIQDTAGVSIDPTLKLKPRKYDDDDDDEKDVNTSIVCAPGQTDT